MGGVVNYEKAFINNVEYLEDPTKHKDLHSLKQAIADTIPLLELGMR